MKLKRFLSIVLSIIMLLSVIPHAFAMEDLAALQAEYQRQLQAAQQEAALQQQAMQQQIIQAQQDASQQVQQAQADAQKAVKQATCKHEWKRTYTEDKDENDGVHDEVTVCIDCEKELDRVTVKDGAEKSMTMKSALRAAPLRSTTSLTVKVMGDFGLDVDTYSIVAEQGDSVKNVKEKIQDKTGIRLELQELYYHNKKLEDEKLLADYGFNYDEALILYKRVTDAVIVKIIGDFGLDHDTYSIIAEKGDFVENVKGKIQDKTGILPERQALYYHNTKLEDGKLLVEYGFNYDEALILDKMVTVTYKVVNGTWADGSTGDKTEKVASGDTPDSVPTDMIAGEGYTGGAWDTDPANVTITEDRAFTYTFGISSTYTVRFDPNVPENASTTCEGNMSDQSFAYDEKKALNANGYFLPGYEFVCWNTKADGTGTPYANEEEVKELSECGGIVTLYAQWWAKPYTIVFNPDDVGGNVHIQTAYFDQPGTLDRYSDEAFGWNSGGRTLHGWAGTGFSTLYGDGADFLNLCGNPRADGSLADRELVAEWVQNGQIIVTVTKDGVPQPGLKDCFKLFRDGTTFTVSSLYENENYVLNPSAASDVVYLLQLNAPGYPPASAVITYGENYAVSVVFAFYTVTVEPPAGGEVKADGTIFQEGKTVTLTVTPEAGFGLDKLTVKYGGTEVTTIKVNDTTYTFIMPAAPVTVTATFKEPAPVAYTVTTSANPAEGGTVQVTGTENADGSYNADTAVTAKATANSGYTFVNWTENGAQVSDSASYQFNIAANRTLVAKFELISADKPTITSQPQNLALTYGYTEGSVSVTAQAPEGCTLSYQWYSNTTGGNENGTKVDGATAASYTIPAGKTAGTEEYYYCVVTAKRNDNGQTATIASNTAKVTVAKAPLTITALPQTFSYNGQIQGEGDPVYDDPAVIVTKVTAEYLKNGDQLSQIKLFGQAKEAGVYEGEDGIVPSDAVIKNGENDKTDNYEITYVSGKLTITSQSGQYIGEVTAETVTDNLDVSAVRLTRSDTTVPGTLAVQEKELAYGTGTYHWTFTPDDTKNYAVLNGTVEITVTGHDWDEPTYTWSADNSSVTATRICKNNAEHKETETAKTTSEGTPATCEAAGKVTYTAEFTNTAFETQTKTVETAALGHKWKVSTEQWAADYSQVTVTFVCENDADHTKTETAVSTANISGSVVTYTAAITLYGQEFSFSKTIDISGQGYVFTQTTQIWVKGSTTGATFRVTRLGDDSWTYSLFTGIRVDGSPVSAYSKAPGSIILTLHPAYLESLSVGYHTLAVYFTDGEAMTDFLILPAGGGYHDSTGGSTYTYVPPSNNPRTGDESNIALWGVLASVSAVGAVLTGRKRKKNKI